VRDRVGLSRAGGVLEITVADAGPARPATGGAGAGPGGHALIGLREERAGRYGGHLTAGPEPGGGFLLHATLPLQPDLDQLDWAHPGTRLTVETHVASVLRKLDLRDRVHAVIFAYESGVAERAEPPR
jgi:hypothetical protein